MTDMMVLIEPMIPALRRYARALLRDRSLADDLVQDLPSCTIWRSTSNGAPRAAGRMCRSKMPATQSSPAPAAKRTGCAIMS